MSAAPAPPWEKPSFRTAACAPCSSASFCTSATSSSVSPGKRFAATTHGRPKCFTFWMWRARLADPVSIARRFSAAELRGSSSRPAWCLSAFAVATITTALGANPPARQTMSMNFCMPRSLPKPASVTT